MSDVARRAGVSRQLVSLVMRGAPGPSAASRNAVLTAAAALNFHVNASARQLRQDRSRLIGVLFDMRNGFETRFVERLVDRARVDGLGVVLGPTTASRPTDVVVSELLSHRVEALACFNPDPNSLVLRQAAEHVPVIWLGERSPRGIFDTVRSDDTEGVRLAVEHLRTSGHRRIAYGGGIGGQVGPDRAQAYRDAMRRSGLVDEVDVLDVGFSEEDGARAARMLLARPDLPTAVVCSSDHVAAGLVTVLRFHGVRVPEDISVTGYDDSELAAISYLDLTSVRQDPDLTAAETLDAARNRRESPDDPARDVATPATLVVRGSTAPPAAS